jgi:hypothetical protein
LVGEGKTMVHPLPQVQRMDYVRSGTGTCNGGGDAKKNG